MSARMVALLPCLLATACLAQGALRRPLVRPANELPVVESSRDPGGSVSQPEIPVLAERPKGVIAFGGLHFGDTPEDFRLHVEQDETITLRAGLTSDVLLAGTTWSMWPSFHRGGLWKLSLSSALRGAAAFDTEIVEDRDALVAMIEGLFGEPMWRGVDPEFLDMQPDVVHFTHRWELEGKRIRIGVGQTDSQFRAALWITDPLREKEREQAGAGTGTGAATGTDTDTDTATGTDTGTVLP